VRLFWQDAGLFSIRDGSEIVIDPLPDVEEKVLRLCILGPGLGVLLHQRGLLILHASAVDLHGTAITFLGDAGQGKSTMAAAMHAKGHRLLADDVTAITSDNGRPTVLPAFPQFKLWPESVELLGEDADLLPTLEPGREKRARRIVEGFSSIPLPLARVYVLSEGEELEMQRLGPQEALVNLVAHSYAARLLRETGASTHFLQCSSLVNSVPIRLLRRPLSFMALPEVVRLVEEDLT
jgi:hypothetical protein